MDVVAMQGFVEDDDGDVGNGAEIDEILMRQGIPYLEQIPED